MTEEYKDNKFEGYKARCNKARLVVRGFSHVSGVDVFDTFSPVASSICFRTFLTIAAILDLNLAKLDVTNAFIHSVFLELVYVWPPEGFAPRQPTDETYLAYKLARSWCGCRQAPRNWNATLHAFFSKSHFVQGITKKCFYTYSVNGQVVMRAIVVVDDILVAYARTESARFRMLPICVLGFHTILVKLTGMHSHISCVISILRSTRFGARRCTF